KNNIFAEALTAAAAAAITSHAFADAIIKVQLPVHDLTESLQPESQLDKSPPVDYSQEQVSDTPQTENTEHVDDTQVTTDISLETVTDELSPEDISEGVIAENIAQDPLIAANEPLDSTQISSVDEQNMQRLESVLDGNPSATTATATTTTTTVTSTTSAASSGLTLTNVVLIGGGVLAAAAIGVAVRSCTGNCTLIIASAKA
ncbi:hypothetical protein TI03_05430, partial [Achromatium sp. WMS1]